MSAGYLRSKFPFESCESNARFCSLKVEFSITMCFTASSVWMQQELFVSVGFNAVLHCARRSKNMELFKSILHEMVEARLKPDKYTFSIVADVAYEAGGISDLRV